MTTKETKTELKERVQDYLLARCQESLVTTMEEGWSELDSTEAQDELAKQIKRVAKLFGYQDYKF